MARRTGITPTDAGQAVVAALNDMLRNAGQVESGLSGHDPEDLAKPWESIALRLPASRRHYRVRVSEVNLTPFFTPFFDFNHLRNGLHATPAERWRWLGEAKTFGFGLASARAKRGLVTLDPHGEILWSPLQEKAWVPNRAPVG